MHAVSDKKSAATRCRWVKGATMTRKAMTARIISTTLPEGLVVAFPKAVRAAAEPEKTPMQRQYERQKIMLDAALINRAYFESVTDLSVAQQRAAEENPAQAKQAATQEKGGSIFSSAYDGRFFGIV